MLSIALFCLTAAAEDPEPSAEVAPAVEISPDLSCDSLVLQAALPSPQVATSLSTVLGFGAGHYYAKNHKVGLIVGAVQVVGIGLLTISALSRTALVHGSYRP
jgi:hypothetical protein